MTSRLDEWPDARLFDAWHLVDYWQPKELRWPDEMDGWTTRQKELWGVLMAKRAIFDAMDGVRVIHRGDAPVWESSCDTSGLIQGDLDVSWDGRSPIFEVKAYLPAVRLRGGKAPASQGLDWPRRFDYLNEQKRAGRPFYVLWVWPDAEDRTINLRGERIDLLDWPPPESSLNRLRAAKGMKMAYWYVENLRPMAALTDDILAWSGQPFQLALV